MQPISSAAKSFLNHKRIAVTGVSRNPQGHGGNTVYNRLRERGYEVFAVNPNAEQVEGDPAYQNLASIPDGVDAVVIATSHEWAADTMKECIDLGIKDVWLHRSIGEGSVTPAATELGRQAGITVIDGGCPLMFQPCDDFAHRIMRPILTFTGKVPRSV